MHIAMYDLLQDDAQHPVLIREDEHTYNATDLSNPEAIVRMLNEVFQADQKCEEHLYMVAMNSANEVLGVFDVSHGTQTETLVDARSIFTRCMLAGAATLVLAHNHPSNGLRPSGDDLKTCEKIRDVGRLMGIFLLDFIIIGKGEDCFSFTREGLCNLKF